ncbi:MAG TPA: type II secretion system F family protein [Patescibacteria group bacterium]|nr:type II secretion system F family protein [Patescibacteria group bacterium]
MVQTKVRLSGKEQLAFFTDLSTMLTAGIPLLEAVELLEPDAKGNIKKVLTEIHKSLNNGDTLGTAMARFPRAFEPVTINLMKAAEMGGTLEDTLKDIVIAIKKRVAFGNSLRLAMIYPAFVMGIFSFIVIMLLTFVIPRIGKVFTSMHVKLPLATRTLIASSNFFIHRWPFVLGGIVLLIVIISIIVKTQKRAIIRMLLGMPGLKHLGLNIDLAQMTRSMTLLLKAGLPIDETLELTKPTVQKKQVLAVIERMSHNVAAGKPLAAGLRNAKDVIPPMMARSLETAETSGTLETTMANLAEHFDSEASESLKAISGLIEPLMVVLVGLMVGALMITVIAPVYTVITQIRPAGS